VAQDLVSKRLNLCSELVDNLQQWWTLTNLLRGLVLERPVVGNFAQSEFDNTDLKHLSPSLAGVLLETDLPAILAFILDEGGSHHYQQHILEALR